MVSCSGSSTLSTYAVMSVTLMAYSSSHSSVGAPRDGGVMVYPWSPGPVTSDRSCSRDARYSTGPLLASWMGWWRRRALGRCVQGARSRAGGRGGAFCGPGWPGSAGSLVAGSGSGGVRSICCSVSSVCSSSSSSRLLMSRAMGSSWACWGAALWCGGCVMLVLGVCAAAGAGLCAGARGRAWFGVVVVCVCSSVAVPASGVAPGRGSGCGRWWALSWRVVCGVSRGGAGGGGWGAEPAWRVVLSVLVGCGVSCPWVGEGAAVWHGGAGLRHGPPLCAGGHRVQVWWGGWSLVAGPRAVWGGPVRSPGRASGVSQYVGRAGSLWCGAWGPLGRGVWDWSVATRGVWSRGAWWCRPTCEWAQWCRKRCVWATRRLPRLWGLQVGGPRGLGRVAAPVRRPWVRSGGAWLGCIVSMVGVGLWARVWGGSVVGYRLAAGAGASLWVGLPRCLLGASRGGPWSAG